MRFMLLLKSNELIEGGAPPDEKVLRDMDTFNQSLIKAGAMLAGEGLHPSKTGFRTSHRAGKYTVKDGPFAEAKELVAGFWMIQARSLAEAVEWTRRVPFGDGEGQIEVRQVLEMADMGMSDDQRPPHTSAPPPSVAAMPKYMMWFNADARSEAGLPPPQEQMEKMGALTAEMAAQGRIVAGDGLMPSSKGARVYFSKGSTRVVDGPFSEAKELIAGFVILRCRDEQEAREYARRGALANGDCQGEVRRVVSEADFPAELVAKNKDIFDGEREFREKHGQQ